MKTFLLHEPPHLDKTTWEKLTLMVNYVGAEASPEDNFLEALGMDPAVVEKLRGSLSEHLRSGDT